MEYFKLALPQARKLEKVADVESGCIGCHSPMAFLAELLGRPPNERPYVMFPIGFPADDAKVPDLRRKPLEEVAVWHE